MIKIYWHNIVLREFSYAELEKAENAWTFFNRFLIKLRYVEE
jgi:hypothetical protein